MDAPYEPPKNWKRLAYRLADAAKALGVSRPEFDAIVAAGEIEVVKAGRRKVVLVENLCEVLDRQPRKPIQRGRAMSGLLDDFLSEPEFAKQIDRALRTVRRWRREQSGPAVTWVGKTPYYRCDSARRWLLNQEQQPVRPAKKRRRRGGGANGP